MEELKLKDIAKHMQGNIINGNKNSIIKKAVINPNRLSDGTLFFCFDPTKIDLRAEGFKRAVTVVTDNPQKFLAPGLDLTLVEVANIFPAYWAFVKYYRGLFPIPLISVTGTCGKTTTTEMIRTILARKYKTHSSWDGNNAWYLSLPYLLGINGATQRAVFEMGVGKPGDIHYMCKHYQPQVGVLLNIGTYHLEGCGTLENYINAKAELIQGVDPNGTLLLNADDVLSRKINLTPFSGKMIYFGIEHQAHFMAKNIKYENKGMSFTLVHKESFYPVYVPGYGKHNVYNALAAIAATFAVGIGVQESIKGLAAYKPIRQHMQIRRGINGCKVIDDSWNCTPMSIESAIEVLKGLGKQRKTVAVFGNMPRLGSAGVQEYYRVGELIAKAGIDYIVTIGEAAKKIGQKCLASGVDENRISFCHSATELYNTLAPLTDENTLVLFKFPYKYRLSKDPSFVEFINKFCK